VTLPLLKPDTSRGFHPRLLIGDDIGKPAVNCLRLDGVLETRLLSPKIHEILLGMSRVRNAVSSFRLEGETVELNRARELLDGREPTTPSELGVLKLAKEYSALSSSKPPDLTVEGLCKLHRRLFANVLQPDWVGVLKPRQNYIVNTGSDSLRFTPTPPERTEAELEALFRWYLDHRFERLPPVSASLFFAEFQAIHPFMDGNGLIGRFLNFALLRDLGCRRAPLIPLDTRFFRTSEHYYDFLGSTNSGESYSLWSRYFVGEVESAYKVAAKQANLGPLVSQFTRESTRTVLRWALAGDGSWFSRGEYPNPTGYSQPALWSALDELVKAGLLEAQGQKRGRRYRLRSRFLADVYARRF
jgi:Fic family protein